MTQASRFKPLNAGGLTVIILSNRTDLDPEKLALQVADIFFSTKN